MEAVLLVECKSDFSVILEHHVGGWGSSSWALGILHTAPYRSAAGGRPAGPVAGSLRSPTAKERPAVPSVKMQHISMYAGLSIKEEKKEKNPFSILLFTQTETKKTIIKM